MKIKKTILLLVESINLAGADLQFAPLNKGFAIPLSGKSGVDGKA